MEKISDYTIIEKLDETRSSLIYRGKKDAETQTVIIKALKTHYPSPTDIARFNQEYDLIRSIDLDGVIKTYDIINDNNSIALVLEDFNGISLDKAIEKKKPSLKRFLKIALDLAETLGNLHKLDIVHRDIKPQNILYNPATERLKVSDFGIASVLTHENEEIYHPDVVKGTLSYISPEQTGRMNRAVDYRTDLYSLGITFYEMLTGSVPFKSKDPMELIHAHIARKPQAPSEMDQAIPEIISKIVMKLMAKTAEERYQNSFGLMADLRDCEEQLSSKGSIAGFELGRNDISQKFILPQILVGREQEITVLLESFDRVMNGNKEFMLVLGYSGIGKSALINEIHKPIVEKRGYFIRGKYERFRKDIPYSSIIQAFQELVKQILSESDERIDIWKEILLEALIPNAKVILEVIPELELIIGEQPDIPKLGPEESQNRFNFVFKKFIQVFATRLHPVVLFLDDLQWADLASLNLIKLLIADPDIQYLFLIGAYRDSEVDETHPIMIMLSELELKGLLARKIFLSALSIQSVQRFLSYFLRCDEVKAYSLSELVYKKTYGNPFFVNQFMKILYDENMLVLDPVSGWKWDIEKIAGMRVTDNVVDLLAHKLNKLSSMDQDLLKICSVIGNQFDLELPAKIHDRPIEKTLTQVTDFMNMGLISFHEGSYRFHHDRIQEAAYSMQTDRERERLHYRIGQLMLKDAQEEELEENIIQIVNHLNFAKSLISCEQERDRLIRLNLRAGKKAKTTAAYEASLSYLKSGIELLRSRVFMDEKEERDDVCWTRDYDLSLSLYLEAAESAYLCTFYDEMEQFSEIILSHAANLLDKVHVYEIKINTFMAQNKLLEAVDMGLEVLKLLGISLAAKPTKADILFAFLKSKLLMLGKSIESLIDLPKVENSFVLAQLRVLTSVSTAAYWARTSLTPLIAFKMLKLSIHHGNAFISPYCYVCYGLILCSMGELENGYRFGNLALNLLESMNLKDQRARTRLLMNTFIRHWKEPLKQSVNNLLLGYQQGLETGDTEFAAHSAFVYSNFIFYTSKDLKFVDQEHIKYTNAIYMLKQKTQLNVIKMHHQKVVNLLVPCATPVKLTGESYDEDAMMPKHLAANDLTALANLYLNKIQLCFIFLDFFQALDYADKWQEVADAVPATFTYAQGFFYDSLTRLAVYDQSSQEKQRQLIKKVSKNQKKMRKWARHAAMNYGHKYCLVEAELARLRRQDQIAMQLYVDAIEGACENEYIQEEAMSCECAARFYLSRGYKDIASSYLSRAYKRYRLWGAMTKVKQLEEKYTDLITVMIEEKAGSTVYETSVTSTSTALDLSTFIKISQALASEFDLNRLLENIMKISMENAGAQKGYLIIENEKDNQLYIQAGGEIDKEIKVLESTPIDESTELSSAVINYVHRTKENLLLNNACEQGMFKSDPYVIKNKCKSVLGITIMHKGKMSGMLYLENNLTTDAFTPKSIEFLQLLSSQAAISIENSSLYNELERRVEERTGQLHQAQQQLLDTAHRAGMSEIATNVLHNVGNILNSVNIAAEVIQNNLDQSKISGLLKANDMIVKHKNDVLEFIKNDSRGKLLPEYYVKIGETLKNEQQGLKKEIDSLLENVVMMKEVINRQQDYVQSGLFFEELNIVSKIADALALQSDLLRRHQIQLRKNYSENDMIMITVQKSKLIQILVNLIQNGIEAMLKTPYDNRILTISIIRTDKEVFIKMADNGIGIIANNLDKMFAFGFTTKEKGHGFGLHSCANFMTEMGGRIVAESDGENMGSSFTLIFPGKKI